ncbi:MarR family winged helix-turn-helix transcriptional regulator [Pseudarthrobacter raffinosi]|uniref:MarR family winged helix-turn-helix transcriptional regulator n=1 Tax=Pseudarthrobacter raffinosi TaxID=2953651 RepID=UPI00208F3096|nr:MULTISPECIES: MarR family winged helix-turn-helix transcriptional regulator [unclassified Pseudarthrobacter]MCO4238009.1 MarR family winged helix-turn-helix transcriptional regulator [Pseudarthrobacter sp. MDT3-28]MCO4251599.1 MarR family winged helix-turn-helix transcriptional regulator [Pseudarthrobacter sp. MDT3-9]MCO4264552.1 MarR family winged helix-turn-helix transcriptional regulator [Pseudarthrobacter sp. MDT3-26]
MASLSSTEQQPDADKTRDLAVAILDISFEVHRKSHDGTGVLPLSSGLLDIIRVIERHPGITVAEVAARLGRQLSNVSAQLRELVALGLVTRTRDVADKRYVVLHPTPEAQRIRAVLESAWAEALESAGSRLLPAEREQLAASLPALERLAGFLAEPE